MLTPPLQLHDYPSDLDAQEAPPYASPAMNPAIAHCFFVLFAITVFPHAAWCDESALVPETGVVVLRNGHVLQGEITKTGNTYVVAVTGGGELRIAATSVDFVAHDLAEAYRVKRTALGRGTARGHLMLAYWCQHHDLLAESADQLMKARSLNPKQPGLDRLENLLLLNAAGPKSTATPTASIPDTVTIEQIERSLAVLSSDAVHGFSNVIQPLLLNRCAATTCHGGRSKSDFQLQRPPWGNSMTQRFTQRNLYATLRIINRESPDQ